MSRSSHLKTLFFFIFLTFLTDATKLSIWHPTALASSFPNNQVPHIYASAGPTPRKRTYYAQLTASIPLDSCSQSQHISASIPHGLVIETGNCSLQTKLHFAKSSGAQFVIVIDQSLDMVEEAQNSQYFGLPNTYSIPVFIVSRVTGQAFLKYLQAKDQSHENQIHLYVGTEPNKQDKLSFDLWMSAGDEESYEFARTLENILKDETINRMLYIHPYFVSRKRENCTNADSCPIDNCLGNGSYCFYNPSHSKQETKVPGYKILYQHVVMGCVATNNHDRFLEYVREFHDRCFKKNNFEETCYKPIFHDLKLKVTPIEQCIVGTYTNSHDQRNSKNSLLEAYQKREQGLFTIWPLLVNQHTHLYHFDSRSPNKFFCDLFVEQWHYVPETCIVDHSKRYINPIVLGLMIIPFVLLCAFMVYVIFKRKAQRELKFDIDQQIQTAIAGYDSMK